MSCATMRSFSRWVKNLQDTGYRYVHLPTYTFLSKSFSFGRKDKLFLTIYRTEGVDLFLAWESTPSEWKSSYCGCRICFRRCKDPSYLAQKTSFFVTCFNSWKQQSGETLERKTAILSAWSRNGAYELEANTSNLVDRKLIFFFWQSRDHKLSEKHDQPHMNR